MSGISTEDWIKTEHGYRASDALLARVTAGYTPQLETPPGRLYYAPKIKSRPLWLRLCWTKVEHGYRARGWYLSYITRRRSKPAWLFYYVAGSVRLRTRLRLLAARFR